jgi:hypothetical protein
VLKKFRRLLTRANRTGKPLASKRASSAESIPRQRPEPTSLDTRTPREGVTSTSKSASQAVGSTPRQSQEPTSPQTTSPRQGGASDSRPAAQRVESTPRHSLDPTSPHAKSPRQGVASSKPATQSMESVLSQSLRPTSFGTKMPEGLSSEAPSTGGQPSAPKSVVPRSLKSISNHTPTSDVPGTRPPRRGVPCWQTASYSPKQHAEMLVGWLTRYNWEIELRYPQMLQLYRQMCRHLNWAVRPWNPVAREVTRLTTGRKVYRWFRDRSDSVFIPRLRLFGKPALLRCLRPRRLDRVTSTTLSKGNLRQARSNADTVNFNASRS